eukprot:SAG31_NODE_7702_length_1613_cov_1.116248_1_plen_86_part_10
MAVESPGNATIHSDANATGFATVGLSREGHAGREHDTGAQLLRASSPEATISIDNITYNIGGLVGQRDFAFLNCSLLGDLTVDQSA